MRGCHLTETCCLQKLSKPVEDIIRQLSLRTGRGGGASSRRSSAGGRELPAKRVEDEELPPIMARSGRPGGSETASTSRPAAKRSRQPQSSRGSSKRGRTSAARADVAMEYNTSLGDDDLGDGVDGMDVEW